MCTAWRNHSVTAESCCSFVTAVTLIIITPRCCRNNRRLPPRLPELSEKYRSGSELSLQQKKKRLHKKIKTQTQSKRDDDNILGVSKRVVWELLAFPVLPSPAVMVQSCWAEQECRSTADRSTDRSALTEVSATSLSVYLTVLPQKWLLCFAPSLALVDLSLHSLSLCSLLPCLLPWKNSLSLSICL